MLIKKYPILEFDKDTNALINPSAETIKINVKLPERLVICFFKEVIAYLLSKGEISMLANFPSEMLDLHIYKFNTGDCAIVQGTIGGPACGAFLEEFISLGVKKVILCGGAGSLKSDITVGKYIVVNEAVRDEGFSYHYLKPSRTVKANITVINKITNYLQTQKIDYIIGKTWTTDAIYRETANKIELRKKEGCIIVEMEQASMLAVAKFRGIEYGAIIYSGDDLSKDEWDSRNWNKQTAVRERLTNICKNIVLSL
ncbi:MAG: nucleoside phosphorylase [Clostridia bacterium]|jgi:uridine phosphorylase|nr:nucleoside phosphorylase [Clostridia bacterium]MDD4275970.1 nucleoside phosphorylase [Clostridia bacterium]